MYNICTQNIPLVVTLRGVKLMYNICTQNIPLVVTLAWCRANVQHLYTEHTTSSNLGVV